MPRKREAILNPVPKQCISEDTLFFFYKDIFYKSIKAEIRKILRIF